MPAELSQQKLDKLATIIANTVTSVACPRCGAGIGLKCLDKPKTSPLNKQAAHLERIDEAIMRHFKIPQFR